MTKKEEMLTLLNVNEGVGNTNMAREKYEIYKEAILKAVPADETGISFKDLPKKVKTLLPEDKLNRLGKLTWHVTSVKLDLEARGLIERIPGVKPQHLRRK